MNNLLTLKDVSKNYHSNAALKQINLSIPHGKIVGLLGPNGSGKSTLIKLINGLLEPTKGTITINGHTPNCETKKVIAYLPERTYLNNWMKVEELLDFFQDFYTDFDRNRALTMLASLNIDTHAKLKTLSKGTKEKVQLILVMSRQADLYILDEPIGGVDPAGRDYILKTIIKNYSETSSILIATHLIQEVEQLCDDVIFLSKGEIIIQGNVDELREEKGQSIDNLFREVFSC